MLWDVFCHVVDNYGDIGVCWRLAADLAARGENVRLWVDDSSALRWMAPHGAERVSVHPWAQSEHETHPGDVVIESFGCELPAAFLARMAEADRAPLWLNLEYLSAEAYVERSHRLPSLQMSGPAQGLTKWFFYPGFTARTGGLLREPGLMQQQETFDRSAWLAQHAISPRHGERLVSVFCYAHADLPKLLPLLGDHPTLLLCTAGIALPSTWPAQVRGLSLPYLTQADYDRLLWSCDLNFVRGEDSFVRAQWAGHPFIWNIYPQHDGVHTDKLQAFLDRFPAVPGLRELWHAWNGLQPWPARLPADWTASCVQWRDELLTQTDLTTQLLGFAAEAG